MTRILFCTPSPYDVVNHSYRGRFAPSPTGPLHFGSMVCAISSFLQARQANGKWLLRMEDLDPPREIAGAASDILKTLEQFGLHWDETVLYQSTRHPAYELALDQLKQQQLTYPCQCSRKTIQINSGNSVVYPGTCRNRRITQENTAIRLRLQPKTIHFIDLIQGKQQQNVLKEVGDFVIKRADGLYAYQLAVVVDDAYQGITEVVRGADLLDNTPRQIYLQSLLGLDQPKYLHVPVITNLKGEKLSKQSFADPVRQQTPISTWIKALRLLGLKPPDAVSNDDLPYLIQWAIEHWSSSLIPKATKQCFLASSD